MKAELETAMAKRRRCEEARRAASSEQCEQRVDCHCGTTGARGALSLSLRLCSLLSGVRLSRTTQGYRRGETHEAACGVFAGSSLQALQGRPGPQYLERPGGLGPTAYT